MKLSKETQKDLLLFILMMVFITAAVYVFK